MPGRVDRGKGDEGGDMCCEQLLCASCHGVVADARCGTCRAARAELHGAHGVMLPAPLIALVGALLVLLTLVLQHAG